MAQDARRFNQIQNLSTSSHCELESLTVSLQWKEALPEQRLVTVKIHPHEGNHQNDRSYNLSPVPVLLHTCTESRSTAEKSGYVWVCEDLNNGGFWFNADKDALYLETLFDLGRDSLVTPHLFDMCLAKKPKKLAIRVGQNNFDKKINILAVWSEFSKFEELWIVAEHHDRQVADLVIGERKIRLRDGRNKMDDASNPWVFVDTDEADVKGACNGYGAVAARMRPFLGAHVPSTHAHGSWERILETFCLQYEFVVITAGPRAKPARPKLRIGMVLPESDVGSLVEMREEHCSKVNEAKAISDGQQSEDH